MTAPVPYLDGHCTHGDQYHALCPTGYVSTFGVAHRCTCPGHERDAEPYQDRGNGAASGYTGGDRNGPGPAVSAAGESQGLGSTTYVRGSAHRG